MGFAVARRGFCGVARLGFVACGGPARLGFCGGPAVFGTKICACEFTRKTKKGQINNKAHCAPTTRRLPLAPIRHYTPTPTAHAHYAPWYDVSPLRDARTLTM